MKETIKTSRTAGYLEKIFRKLNEHYFASAIEEPIITIQSTPRAYGHITVSKDRLCGLLDLCLSRVGRCRQHKTVVGRTYTAIFSTSAKVKVSNSLLDIFILVVNRFA